MAKHKKSVGLIAFLRGNTDLAVSMPGCANYDHHYGGCLFNDTCLVEQGKRCGYFERAVLPTAENIGLKSLVYEMYQRHVGIEGQLDRAPIRTCAECGAEVKPRKRYCENCAKRKRRETYRRSRKRKAG